MGILLHGRIIGRGWRNRIVSRILAHRVRYHHPTMLCHDTTIWDYAYADIDAIQIGKHVSIGPYAEIRVYKRSPRSSVEGRLILGDRVLLGAGVNIIAAGGTIRLGEASGIGQHSVAVAANHQVRLGREYLYTAWNETRTGVEIGDNVWVAANCVLLPGTRIGSNSVIGAGSVVSGEVPANEIWAGVPARKVKDVPADGSAGPQTRSEQSPAPPG